MLLQIEIDSFAKIQNQISKLSPKIWNEEDLPVFTMTKPGLATITLFFAYFWYDFDLKILDFLHGGGSGSQPASLGAYAIHSGTLAFR